MRPGIGAVATGAASALEWPLQLLTSDAAKGRWPENERRHLFGGVGAEGTLTCEMERGKFPDIARPSSQAQAGGICV